MRTHTQVSLNQLQSLLNSLRNSGNNLSISKRRRKVSKNSLMSRKVKRGPGRPRKQSVNHGMREVKNMCPKHRCTRCGCGRNRKSKVILVQRRPKGKKMVSRALVSNNNLRSHRPSLAQTKRDVRSIINKLVSRKNHTRSTNLASMIERIHTKSQSNKRPKMTKMAKCRGHQLRHPVVKSHTKTVKSYYTSSNNGTHKVERGRRIEDDSANPFIKVNTLNNGQMKSFQVSRH